MSEQAKFTAGPWSWSECGDDNAIVHLGDCTVGGVYHGGESDLLSHPDARLIAAAPELLSTLQAASAQLDSACRDFAALVETSEACMSTNALRARQGSLLAKLAAVNCERAAQKAQAVISKATGT